ncbi:hypothetical protein CC86DRAFT_281653 [Ophiobolus disseminans]|uniref:Chitin-binding type-1 domain-containing protein n=1 Tax=Ophiobolus disseminans TaxID=1469910 RepID=A0A6A7AFQ6_9PLEO|nr:hypothetical protein CC86DRAFT_281653 [Ophiobolus disseminans]
MRFSIFLATFFSLTFSVQAATISRNARCGTNYGGTTCQGTSWGSCCSSKGWWYVISCVDKALYADAPSGTTDDHCSASKGCQSGFGTCAGQTTDPSLTVSQYGSCGVTAGQTCANSAFGNCCSQYNYCGSSAAYCSTGCQSKYGNCNNVASSSQRVSSTFTRTTSARPLSTQAVSQDARCGAGFAGQTCQGSTFGNCCSKYFYVSLACFQQPARTLISGDYSVEARMAIVAQIPARKAMESAALSLHRPQSSRLPAPPRCRPRKHPP